MSAQNLENYSMMDLFRSEVETHTAAMSRALLALENDSGNMPLIEELMRAAHSIKGGARIVELGSAVRLAHTLEDCFVAVRKKGIQLTAEHTDILLQSVDMLVQLAETGDESRITEELSAQVNHLTEIISSIPNTEKKTEVKESVPKSADVTVQPESAIKPLIMNSQTEPETVSLSPDTGSKPEPSSCDAGGFLLSDSGKKVSVNPDQEKAHSKADNFLIGLRQWHSFVREVTDSAVQSAIAAQGKEPDIPCSPPESVPRDADDSADQAVIPKELTVPEAKICDFKPEPAHCKAGNFTSKSAGEDTAAPADARSPVSGSSCTDSGFAESPAPETAVAPHTDISPIYAAKSHADNKHPETADNPHTDTSPASLKITGQERTVRVTASKIERLMGLAGEVVVAARWLPPFTNSMLMLKRSQRDTSLILDEMLKELSPHKEMEHALSLCLQLRENIKAGSLHLAERINDIDMFTNISAAIADRLYHEVIGVRMCPFSEGTQKYPRTVRDLARKLGKKARLEILGESTEVDRDILEKLDAPINHLLCNAVAHGIESPEKRLAGGKPETGTIRIEATHRAGMLMIIVSDDGAGIDSEELRAEIIDMGKARPDIARHLSVPELMDFLFLPGFSTAKDVTEIAGRGVGLDVVHSTVHEVGGVIRVSSVPGKGLSFHMELPLTLSVIRTFLVEIAGETYAFPLARIDRCIRVERSDMQVVEDRQYFRFDGNNIALVDIREVLELPASDVKRDTVNVVVVSDRSHAYGMVVDRFLGECDLVVRPLDSRLGKIPDISAAAVMMDGSPVLIFDVEDMVHSIGGLLSGKSRLSRVDSGTEAEDRSVPKRILVVEDSFIVREKERKILENRGYEVDVAVDGQDGWNCLRTATYDMVVTDIDMPRMNGFELIRNIRQHTELASLPVVVVSYKASDDDRLQGLKAGANYYLTKTDFDDNSLTDAVVALIGDA